jgi:hypothetical protein
MVVVYQHVMVSAQKDPVCKIRFTTVSSPVIDVVSFGPTCRTIALPEHAPTVAYRKCDFLVRSK